MKKNNRKEMAVITNRNIHIESIKTLNVNINEHIERDWRVDNRCTYINSVTVSKVSAINFLKKAGILDSSGELSSVYK